MMPPDFGEGDWPLWLGEEEATLALPIKGVQSFETNFGAVKSSESEPSSQRLPHDFVMVRCILQ
ncbi:MAG: hypothetical protein JWP84_731 [Tardiphaga sp.]|nr:hypothetical protein [Tardiphaga sp.]